MADNIKSPNHYTANGFECVEMLEAMGASYDTPHEGYLVESVGKYLYRAPFKGQKLADLYKAHKFLEMLIHSVEGKKVASENMLDRFRRAPADITDPDIFEETS